MFPEKFARSLEICRVDGPETLPVKLVEPRAVLRARAATVNETRAIDRDVPADRLVAAGGGVAEHRHSWG